MSKLEFSKMHGTGNDFMVVDATVNGFVPTREQIVNWSDRHFGVGFDQFLLVTRTDTPGVDFNYRIFNADGDEVEQCGNGARCFARFVTENGLNDKAKITVATMSGVITLELLADGGVRVDMGIPEFNPVIIPLLAEKQYGWYHLDIMGVATEFAAVSLGNPHAVLVVDDVFAYPVAEIGPYVESHSIFPNRVNVGFMQVIDRHSIKLRVYERGVGETLACGTGACAAVVCGINNKLMTSNVSVEVPGGFLEIDWAGQNSHVFMTGSAEFVYTGSVNI